MNTLARLNAKSTAPVNTAGEEQDACTQHYNVHYLKQPATDYSDWDLAKEISELETELHQTARFLESQADSPNFTPRQKAGFRAAAECARKVAKRQ